MVFPVNRLDHIRFDVIFSCQDCFIDGIGLVGILRRHSWLLSRAIIFKVANGYVSVLSFLLITKNFFLKGSFLSPMIWFPWDIVLIDLMWYSQDKSLFLFPNNELVVPLYSKMEKEMATHSSVLAWRIPGMGEPGGLPSLGSHSRTRLKRLSSKKEINGVFLIGWFWISLWTHNNLNLFDMFQVTAANILTLANRSLFRLVSESFWCELCCLW